MIDLSDPVQRKIIVIGIIGIAVSFGFLKIIGFSDLLAIVVASGGVLYYIVNYKSILE